MGEVQKEELVKVKVIVEKMLALPQGRLPYAHPSNSRLSIEIYPRFIYM